tara:strand:- start:2112 stop:3437 length:1326 start_codon:yes stop_codon:yes gene_type:complete
MPQGTGGMGTGSDTRLYAPRSESSHMFRNNHEEDTYGLESQKVRDAKMDKKIREREETQDKLNRIKHIKVKPSDIQQFIEQEGEEERDDSEKVDADRELHAQTGPAGNLGAMTSLANQARGPGFAGGYAFAAGEPMEISFQLLKEKKSEKSKKKARDKRRRSEKRKEWRPSTGKFKQGPGGTLGPKGATMRRHKSRMRAVKRGKLSGLMDAPKAVEMEHRGVAIKQPKSKDPAPYKEFLGQQEAKRRLGHVRSPTSSQFRFGARKYYAGKTGGGRLQGVSDLAVKRPRLHPVRMPKIQPPAGLSTPHLAHPEQTGPGSTSSMGAMAGMPSATPPMKMGMRDEPSMVATGEFGDGSELQKAKFGYYEITELRQLINQAKRALARKEKKRKAIGVSDTGGAATTHSRHKQTPTGQTTKPQGGTENADAENIGGVVGVKGGRTA